MDKPDPEKTTQILVIAAMILGASVALLAPRLGASAPEGHVVIGDEVIPLREITDAEESLASELDRPLTDDERSRVATSVIDEAILVHDAIEMGLAAADPLVRTELSRAMLDWLRVLAESETDAPSDAELREYFDVHPEAFTGWDRRSISAYAFSEDDVTGAEDAAVTLRAGDAPDAPLTVANHESMTPGAIADTFGGTLSGCLIEADPGMVCGPYTVAGRQVVALLESVAPSGRGFDEVRDEVEAAWQRDAIDVWIGAYLEARRADLGLEP